MNQYPLFCITTPVFDGCCRSIELLVEDLQRQTYTNFQQILISNGPSLEVKALNEKINDKRVIYREYPAEDTSTPQKLIENLGKRRNYCIKSFTADRYFFFDADLKIIDDEFFNKIKDIQAEVIVSKIQCYGQEYPILPIKKGTIDLANYSISKKIAEQYSYPTEYEARTDVAFDWRFFSKIRHEGEYHSKILYAIKDGNNTYTTVSRLFIDSHVKRPGG